MKRLIAGLLAVLLLLLCSCSRAVEEPELQEDLTVIGISQVGAESDWRVANSESMKAVFSEERGYRLLYDDARQKQENQITAVRKFIQQDVDFIVLMPISETGWDSVLQETRDAGIPAILVDRMADVMDETLYTAHVGSDFYAEGQQAAEWMEQKYGYSGKPLKIVHIQGTLGSTAQIGRTAALDDVVEAHENWSVLARLDGDFTQTKSYEVMCQYLEGLPASQEIDVVYCENDNEAFGAIQALEERGYVCGRDVDVISFDAARNALELCMQGKIALDIECNPLLGPLVEDVIKTIQKGEIPPKQNHVQEQYFTPETLTQEIIDARQY